MLKIMFVEFTDFQKKTILCQSPFDRVMKLHAFMPFSLLNQMDPLIEPKEFHVTNGLLIHSF